MLKVHRHVHEHVVTLVLTGLTELRTPDRNCDVALAEIHQLVTG